MQAGSSATLSDKEKNLKQIALVVYVLQALTFFSGITAIAAVVINYVKLDDTIGTWIESHFRWQIRTFWLGLLWGIIGVIACVIVIGVVILFIDLIWIIYRIVKGWLALNENKPIGLIKGQTGSEQGC